jgi:hypothetical protein
MKAPSLIIIFFLLCMMVVLVALGMVSVHSQRTNAQVMERVIADLTARSTHLESELKLLREQPDRSAAESGAPPAAAPETPANLPSTNAVDAAVKPPLPQPFQARAFVGKDFIGMAWVVPSNIKENAETGDYQFEPVIWIDEKSRKTFTQTNVVEREVVRNNSYTQVYQQPYWNSYPVWVRPSHPIYPPAQRPPPTLPSPGRPALSSPPIIGQGDRSMSMGP